MRPKIDAKEKCLIKDMLSSLIFMHVSEGEGLKIISALRCCCDLPSTHKFGSGSISFRSSFNMIALGKWGFEIYVFCII